METNLKIDITVADICDGFVYNQFEGKGLFGLGGKLTIQPEYQRNYIYADGGGKKEQAVIKTKAHSGTTSACAPVFGELTKTHCAHSAWSHCRQFIALLGSSSHLAKIWPNEISSASHMVMIPHFGHKINPRALPQRGRDTKAKTP